MIQKIFTLTTLAAMVFVVACNSDKQEESM